MRREGVAGDDARDDRRAEAVGEVKRVGAGDMGGLEARPLAAREGGRVEARAAERKVRGVDWGDQLYAEAARYKHRCAYEGTVKRECVLDTNA